MQVNNWVRIKRNNYPDGSDQDYIDDDEDEDISEDDDEEAL